MEAQPFLTNGFKPQNRWDYGIWSSTLRQPNLHPWCLLMPVRTQRTEAYRQETFDLPKIHMMIKKYNVISFQCQPFWGTHLGLGSSQARNCSVMGPDGRNARLTKEDPNPHKRHQNSEMWAGHILTERALREQLRIWPLSVSLPLLLPLRSFLFWKKGYYHSSLGHQALPHTKENLVNWKTSFVSEIPCVLFLSREGSWRK